MMHDTTSFGKTQQLFFHLLRCGATASSPDEALFPLTDVEWQDIWLMSQQQAVAGVVFSAVQKLPQDLRPDRKSIFLPWLSETTDTLSASQLMNQACTNVHQKFNKIGFKACILKGQGVARLYPNALLRQAGDIDVWLWPSDVPMGAHRSLCARRTRIIKYVYRHAPNARPVYHHVDFNVLKQTQMEVHFTPTWMNSPRRNCWLQRWFERQAEHQFGDTADGFCIPSPAFNAVYLLLHIYRHLFSEGIGLRQLTDYFCLLHSWKPSPEERAEIAEAFSHLGVKRFAGALMYVLAEVFGLEREKMLTPPAEKEGRHLLREVMLAGNFGHSDTRFTHHADGTLGAFLTRTRRNMKFLKYYPSEVLWSPLWKLWHFFWSLSYRKKHL